MIHHQNLTRSADGAGDDGAAGAVWRTLVEDVRRYPSPHNSRPIKLGLLSETSAKVTSADRTLPTIAFTGSTPARSAGTAAR